MMDKNELLYDHFKETYSLHLKVKKKRDTLFIMLCIGITLLFCLHLEPVGIFESVNEMMKEKYSLEIPFAISTVQSFVWIMVLCFFIRYFQTSIYIERQYKYFEKLEEIISQNYKIDFYRESKNYENNYPIILSIIYRIYVYVFPALAIFVIVIKIYYEFINITNIISLIFNSIIALLIVILNIFYLVFIIKKNN